MRLHLDTGVLDLDGRQLVASGGRTSLSPMEARLLGYLAERLGQRLGEPGPQRRRQVRHVGRQPMLTVETVPHLVQPEAGFAGQQLGERGPVDVVEGR